MYYSEGYGQVFVLQDDDGNIVIRRVENVRLLDQFDVDKSIRPMVDSSPGELNRPAWNFDSYYKNARLDRALALVVE